jgi:hypothetical protein
MRWAGHVARMGEEISVQGFGGKARERETSWETQMGGKNQNGTFLGVWL